MVYISKGNRRKEKDKQIAAQFPPQRFYDMSQQQGTVLMAPPGELPPQTIWALTELLRVQWALHE